MTIFATTNQHEVRALLIEASLDLAQVDIIYSKPATCGGRGFQTL